MRLFALPIRDLETGRTPRHPDLQPLRVSAPADRAFSAVATVAGRLKSWTVVKVDTAGHVLTAEARSRVWGFVDDVTIRVETEGSGAVVNMRSRSRTGNIATKAGIRRIQRFLARVETELKSLAAGTNAA